MPFFGQPQPIQVMLGTLFGDTVGNAVIAGLIGQYVFYLFKDVEDEL